MKFAQFATVLTKLEAESSRTVITEILAELLAELAQSPQQDEVSQGVYLLTGRVAAEYEPMEFKFAAKSVAAALAEHAVQLDNGSEVDYDPKQRLGKLGDAGKLAAEYVEICKFESAGLELSRVFADLTRLTEVEGTGSHAAKSEILLGLIEQMNADEALYLGRIVTGKLRLGVSKKTLLDAISWAKVGDKSLRKALDRAYGLRADVGGLAELVLVRGEDPEQIKLEFGVPLAAQLVEREQDSAAILKRLGEAIVQPKYDGLRAQVHVLADGEVKIFSRNLESLTDMFPDLIAYFKTQGAKSMILDGEIIGYDESTESFLPFQETSQRRRKYGVEEAAVEIPIKYFAFDLLAYEGRDLTNVPLAERLGQLEQFVARSSNFDSTSDANSTKTHSTSGQMVAKTDSPSFSDPVELDQHFRNLLDAGLEGIIAKDSESVYSPGKRGYDWIKLKANTHSDLKDTVDCVILGYYYGRGQRARFGIGGFLAGVYNPDSDSYQSLVKVGSGVKEDEWPRFKAQLDEIVLAELPDNYEIHRDLVPDVIVAPEVVIEIDADEISLSGKHLAKVDPASGTGFSLRFPRLKVWGRDKDATATTSPAELSRLYELARPNKSKTK